MSEKKGTEQELNPCPFCGGEPEIARYGTPQHSTIYECSECGCRLETGETWGHGYRWNQRASPAAIDLDFIADLERSRSKYPNNARMFDGLMGEIDELRRAYAGDGNIRAEAFDVAVCAYRIATEGDSGGNTEIATPPATGARGIDRERLIDWARSRHEAASTYMGASVFSHLIEDIEHGDFDTRGDDA